LEKGGKGRGWGVGRREERGRGEENFANFQANFGEFCQFISEFCFVPNFYSILKYDRCNCFTSNEMYRLTLSNTATLSI